MDNKIKLFFKEIFLFSILIIVILASIPGSFAEEFNVPIYIQTSAGIEKASSDIISSTLFDYNFEIKKMWEYVPDEKCSLRAEDGILEVENKTFKSKNKLNFNIPLKNDGPGQGSLTAQDDRERFSLSFEVKEILETNSERLTFKAIGYGGLNKKELNFNEIIVTFDKISNKINITSDKNFNAKNLDVGFIKGCSGQETIFYLITNKDKLNKSRNLEEVEVLLKQYPELIDAYENLRNPVNVPLVPEFGAIIGALTILSAVGVFFVIRRR